MQMTETQKTRGGLSDRTLNRLIVGAIVALVIIVPLIGVIYFLDRSTDPGPSMAQRAVTSAEEAVRKEPNNVTARIALATAYVAAERLGDAVTQYTTVLEVSKDHRGALLGRGRTYVLLGDDASATKDFERMVEIAKGGEMAAADPQLEEAYYRLGDIALRGGRYQEAVDMLTAALKINRGDADAMNLLGAAYVKTGQPKEAIEPLRRAVAFVPTGWCDPYQNLAAAYGALGDTDGAAWANGMVAFCTQQPDVAIAALTPLTTGTYAVDALLGLGMIAEEQADVDTATSMYLKVLEKDPANFNATTGLKRLGTVSSLPPGHQAVPGSSSAPASSAAPIASPSTGANP